MIYSIFREADRVPNLGMSLNLSNNYFMNSEKEYDDNNSDYTYFHKCF